MKKIGSVFLFFAAVMAVLFYSGCETELDVNDEWDDVTVVYGLLDPNANTHYIKINKSFLGPADAYAMAQVRDSSEYGYDQFTAYIEQWKDGSLIKTIPLDTTTITNKESGDFYNPEQTVYYFQETLDRESTYKLVVDFGEGQKTVTAETEIINSFGNANIGGLLSSPSIPVNMYNGGFIDITLPFTTVADGKRYQITMWFYYESIYADSSIVVDSISITLPSMIARDVDGGEGMEVTMSGEEFFNKILKLPDVDDNLVRRRPLDEELTFKFTIGGEELHTYIEVNEPSIGLIQEKPAYTNIENGIGIFSTRTQTRIVRIVGKETLKELATNPDYISKGFCDPNAPYTGFQCESCNAPLSCN